MARWAKGQTGTFITCERPWNEDTKEEGDAHPSLPYVAGFVLRGGWPAGEGREILLTRSVPQAYPFRPNA